MTREQAERVLRAWTVPGSHPAVHRKMQDRLRKQWPRLADALDAAAGTPWGERLGD